MPAPRRVGRSYLLLVRIWTEETGDSINEPTWRGRVQLPGSGETHNFTGWQGLLDAVLRMVPETGDNRPREGKGN